MAEYVNGTTDIVGGSVIRYALNTTTPNQAVIRKIIAGNGITITSTGVDAGTGDVTISVDINGSGGGTGGGGTGGGGGTSTGLGTVTSVNMTVPQGLTVLGAPITTAGTLAVQLSSGYTIPLYVDVQKGVDAYNNAIMSLSYSTSTGIITLTQRDGDSMIATITLNPFTTSNLAEGTNLYYTDARARGAISLTTNGTSGPATYSSTTGVLNIPQYLSTNIYNSDGTLTGNRVVTSGGFNLTFNPKTFFDSGITLNATTGNVATHINLHNYATNSTQLYFYPDSGTNVGQTVNIVPRGTGFNSAFKSQFSVYNNDVIADGMTNAEFVTFRAAGTLFTFASGAFGTGVIRPLMFSSGYAKDSATNINQLYLTVGGNVIIGGASEQNFKLDVVGTARVQNVLTVGSGQADAAVIKNQNSDGSLVFAGSPFNNSSIPVRTIIISTVGSYAGLTGASNLFVGRNAGSNVTSGTSNVFIGKSAGAGITTGGGNIIVASTDANSLHIVAGNGYRNNDASSIPTNIHAFIGGGFNTGFAIKDFYFGQMPFTADAGSGLTNIVFHPPSGLGTDIGGSNFTIAGGRGTGTGTPGDVIFSTSTATTTGTTLQTLTNRARFKGGTGQFVLNAYTSTSSFTGTAAGYLAFDASGNVITTGNSGPATFVGSTLNIPVYTNITDGLVSGGIVTWSGTGFIYDVSAAYYYLGGVYYTTSNTQVTLGAADVSNPRIDIVAVNNLGQVIVIPGVPGSNPVKAQIDPTTQIELATILVPAGATSPVNILTAILYDEVVNSTWSSSASGVTVDFANATTPYTGSVTASVNATTTGTRFIQFTRISGTDSISNYSVFKFAIRLGSAWTSTSTLAIGFYNNNTLISTEVSVLNGAYGFNSATTATYQLIQIPIANWRFTQATFNRVRLRFINSLPAFRIDRVELQAGVVQTLVQANNIYTSDGSLAGIRTLTLNGNYLDIVGSSATTRFNSDGSLNIGGTVTATTLASGADKLVLASATGVLSAVTIGTGLSYSGGILTATGTLTSSSFQTDYDDAITGLRNSINTAYTTSQNFVSGSTRVFVNGVRQSRGGSYDYTETAANQITFNYAPDSGDLIVIDYIKS
jgi:hypothetical protein